MNASMKQMWAVQCEEFGSPDVLVYRELPIPKPGTGQILIKVESAAVNFADVLRRRNSVYPFPTALPYIPGSEVAGIVEALGAGVAGPPVGTPVFALVGNDGSTGYAQYALANAPQVTPLPPGLSKDIACGLIVAGATAVLTLKESARLQAGEGLWRVEALASTGTLRDYHPLYLARADMLRRLGRGEEARASYLTALDLCQNRVERAAILQQLNLL